MYSITIIITKKILLYEQVLFGGYQLHKKTIRSKMSGFFLMKIFGTAFQMIIFNKKTSPILYL
ncbi:hypothetical protein HOO68_02725 [Candidatus Gracilibacteria bacterium]|nr:hypothetical protein [Candidatus Gracilibacteria bacterium]